MWVVFGVTVAVALAVDIGVFHRKAKPITAKSALIETVRVDRASRCFSPLGFIFRGGGRRDWNS